MGDFVELHVGIEKDFYQRLGRKLGHQPQTDLVADALTLLDWAADQARQGRDILSVNESREDPERISLSSLEALRSRVRQQAA